MQIGEFVAAIKPLADEKGVSEEVVLEAVEMALGAAYRKDYGKPGQAIKVKIDTENNRMNVWRVYNVIAEDEEITNPEAQLSIESAQKFKKKAKAEDVIEIPLEVKSDFGRVAAQTAKQVIIQRLREAEREVLYLEFKSKEYKIVNATVQRVEGPSVILDLGKINGIMLPPDQIPSERYYTGQRLKVWVREVEETARGPRILVSRSDAEFIKGLFAQEVPEIETGSIEIVTIAREAGSRTKIAVKSNDENLDPVGSVVGQRGTRVQSVLGEIPNEKIDIILYNDDLETMIKNALSPAKIDKIKLDKKKNTARIWVPEDQLALAIGRSGQNVRLASKITNWILDIVKDEPKPDKKSAEPKKDAKTEVAKDIKEKDKEVKKETTKE
ncbi:MAG: transcription termination factor NusA [Candidatus Berkelbacteria bacterium]|nr:transcription termination factor NusA [Candidatus Berkelbacteria bacterium]